MKNRFLFLLFFLFVSAFLNSCSSFDCTSQNQNEQQKILKNLPEGNFQKVPNRSETYLLIIEKNKCKTNLIEGQKIYVYDKSNDEIIFQDFIPQGRVFWKDSYTLQVEKFPGTIKKNEETSAVYFYNVRTREKTSK